MAFHQDKTLKNWNNSKAKVRSLQKEKIQRSKAEVEKNLQKKNNSKAEVRSLQKRKSKDPIEETYKKK